MSSIIDEPKIILEKATEENTKSLSILQKEFASIRSGRISADLLDGIKILVYGSTMSVSSIGNVNVHDHRTLCVNVWDANNLKSVEGELQQSSLGFSIRTDGLKVFASLPEMSQERREELVKVVRKKVEETRVRIRNIRREVNESIKKLKSDGKISEDIHNQTLEESQKITDLFVQKVDVVLQEKEKSLSTI